MLTYGEINKIKAKIINDYRINCGKYKIFWEYTQKEICSKKYSVGGKIYPYGMYFISKITEKEYDKPLGRFTDDPRKFDFEYCYSSDDVLKIITKKGKTRTFLEYNDNSICLFSYDLNSNERAPNYLTSIGYDYAEKGRRIFVHTCIWKIRGFSLDIEELLTSGDTMTGYSYHLMSDDYRLIYGEDTPNEILDDCAVFLL